MKQALTYDDIQLIPQYSEIQSRSSVSLETRLSRNFNLIVPYIASPMDTICETEMAIKMMNLGGVGCIHRFMSIEEQAQMVKDIQLHAYSHPELESVWGDLPKPIMAAIGSNGDYLERAQRLVEAGANVILIDVAHGHHKNVKDAIESLIEFREKTGQHFDIIAGNVATANGAIDLEKWGADGVRVGIGGGSLCTTRIQTGHGVPNVTSIMECVSSLIDVPVMADGGLRTSGDIAKALAVGAECVMLGSLFAGTQETPGPVIEKGTQLYKRYRGSASLETKSTHGQATRNVEGESTIVPFKGGVKFVVQRLNDGLRSALSYTGARSVGEYMMKAQFVEVTNSGIAEAKPHLL